uniref:Uncharacterized protein n=1 Tax=Rhizophora mucronata TaxID=61149 RepID=A0A2P2PXB8_RHIMU
MRSYQLKSNNIKLLQAIEITYYTSIHLFIYLSIARR